MGSPALRSGRCSRCIISQARRRATSASAGQRTVPGRVRRHDRSAPCHWRLNSTDPMPLARNFNRPVKQFTARTERSRRTSSGPRLRRLTRRERSQMIRTANLVCVTFGLVLPMAVSAEELAPLQAGTFSLRDHTASVYYTARDGNFEVVTTIAPDAGEGAPARCTTQLAPGQIATVSVGSLRHGRAADFAQARARRRYAARGDRPLRAVSVALAIQSRGPARHGGSAARAHSSRRGRPRPSAPSARARR